MTTTTLCLLLQVAAILLATTRWRALAGGAAAIVGSIAAWSAVQYLLVRNFGTDELFFHSYLLDATSPSGRMSPITGVALTFAAVATLLLVGSQRFRQRTAVAAACALVVGVLGFAAMIGYVAGIPTTYAWGAFTRVAVHTAVALVIISVGLVALAWYAEHRGGEPSPKWLWPAALAGGLISTGLIAQALSLASVGETSALREPSLIPEMIFVFGAVLSVMLARAVHLTQVGRRQRDELAALMTAREQAALEAVSEAKRHERALEQSLVEKEALLKEVHHRVKNNLQVMASILGLQAHLIEDPRYRAKFDACRDRIRTMATVHERLYRNDSLASIEFGSIVRDLTTMAYRSRVPASLKVELEFELEPVRLNVDTAMPASLIVHELVANAFSHAFAGRDGGVVHTTLKRVGSNRIALTVRDDGVGGVVVDAVATAPTLGMKIVRDLVRQIEGTLTVANEGGSDVRVEFPDPLGKAA
jgi:two-component sensor histidine kinase